MWLIAEVVGLASVILMLLDHDVLVELVEEGTVEGVQMSPEFLLVAAVFFLVPLVMAFVSLVLKGSINRWVNIIVGIVWFGLGLTDLPKYLAEPSAYAILMWLSGGVTAVLVVWFAWKSKGEG